MDDFAIVIGTSPGREDWLAQCLASIDREVLVISGFGFELRKLQYVFEKTSLDRFVFLQDSMKILDNSMFDRLSESTGSQCLIDDPDHFGSFVGVYEREFLNAVGFPRAFSKSLSIFYEREWTSRYLASAGSCGHVLGKAGTLGNRNLFGRENLVLGNEFFEKYKGDWGQLRHDDSLVDAISLGQDASQEGGSYNPFHMATEDAIKNAVQEVKELRFSLEKLQADLLAAETERKTIELELDAVMSSKSWTMTKPLRKVTSWWIKE